MTAIAATINPATPAKSPAPGSHFGTDAVYKGYDLMVRRFATHIIREPRVSNAVRADLVRAISSPAVTFAASASDGAILLTCPDGLPAPLIPLAEALAQDSTAAANIGQKLDLLDQKLATILQDQGMIERISDRLELLEHALRDRPDPALLTESTRALDLRLDQLGERLAAVSQAVTQIPVPPTLDLGPLEHSLSQTEARLLTAMTPPTDLSAVLSAVDQLSAQIANIPQAEAKLAQVETQLDALANRPVPTPDMTAHEQALTLSSSALALTVTRLDQALDRLPDAQTLSHQADSLATLIARIDDTPAEIERRLAPRVDMTEMTERVTQLDHVLREQTEQTEQTAASHAASHAASQAALMALSGQISELAARPQPVLNLDVQNAGLTDIARTLADMAQQINALTHIAAAGPDLLPLATQYDTLMTTLGQPAQSAEMAAALSQLGVALTSLAARPEPVLDVSDLSLRIDGLSQTMASAPQIDARFDRLWTVLGQPAQHTPMTEALTSLAAQTLHLIERPQPSLDLSDHTQSLRALEAPLNAMAQRLDAFAQALDDGPDLSALYSGFDRLLAALGKPAQEAMLSRTATQVSQLAQRLDSLSDSLDEATDLSNLSSQLAAGLAQLGQPAQEQALRAALADLTEQLAMMAERPAPVIDMTTQRQSFAQFGTTLALAVQRLETVAAGMTTPIDQAPIDRAPIDRAAIDLDPILAQLAALRADLAAAAPRADMAAALAELSNQMTQMAQTNLQAAQHDQGQIILAELAAFGEQIANLTRDVAQGPDVNDLLQQMQAHLLAALPSDHGAALASLTTHVTDLVGRPDPMPDLTAQRQDFARFAQTLTLTATRLEDLTRQVVAQDPAGIVTQIVTMQNELAAQTHHDLADLSQMVTALLDRPDTAPDVAEHKQHLAAFAQGLAELVQWLDPMTRDLVAGPDFAPILSEFDLLRSELNLQARDNAVQAAFDHLSDQIADLAKSPDTLISLSEQRRSFASFSNALAFMLQRLVTAETGSGMTESGLPEMGLTLDPQGAEDRLATQMAAIAEADLALAAPARPDLVATLSRLVPRLEALLIRLDNEPPQRQLTTVLPPEPAEVADPDQLVQTLAIATSALVTVVNLLESATGQCHRHPADQTSVVDLFERLDAALDLYDLQGTPPEATLTQAITDLWQALHGAHDPDLPPLGHEIACLQRLRHDFAELVARALQRQFDSAQPSQG